MGRPAKKPTDYELEILNHLWLVGSGTVDDVLAEVSRRRVVAYTSVQSTLNAMVDKGLLVRSKEGKAFLYVPRVSKTQTTKSMIRDMIGRLFDGSATGLVTALLKSGEITPQELEDVKRRIEKEADRGGAPDATGNPDEAGTKK